MESKVYNTEGKAVGKVTLPESVFGVSWNGDLVHQVVTSMQANARTSIAHTKTRGEVRGGGRKPWKQKGTGRARHGSRRSPIWAGGGVTFGPRSDRNFSKKINKKMRTKALYATLSRKLKDGEIIFLETLSITEPKTKNAKAVVSALSSVAEFGGLQNKKKNAALIALSENDAVVKKSFKNIGNITVDEIRNLNPVDVLSYKYIVVTEPKKAVDLLTSKSIKMGDKKEVKAEAKPKKEAKTAATQKKAPVKKVPAKTKAPAAKAAPVKRAKKAATKK